MVEELPALPAGIVTLVGVEFEILVFDTNDVKLLEDVELHPPAKLNDLLGYPGGSAVFLPPYQQFLSLSC